jgi:hypothetical protein
MSALLELAERCEQATGPDRELDAAIFNAASEEMERWNRRAIRLPLSKFRSRFDDGWVSVYAGKGEDDPYAEDLRPYTASLDAAMTLVPEGWRFAGSESMSGGFYAHLITRELVADGAKAHAEAHADTLALAISAAALKARNAQVDRSPEGQDGETRLDRNDESAVAESDAPDTSSVSTEPGVG